MWRIRSLLFNFFFYGVSGLLLAMCVPLLLAPKQWQRRVPWMWVSSTYWIEKHILGLDYQVIGRENLPPAPYLVAMKHQSVWETIKLYALFGDPAIVLKKELMDMVLWGRYARAMDMVPIDRSRGREAVATMVESAKRILVTKRPLVIFPQGTRVRVGDKQPYKAGVSRLYEALSVPIVPVAHNAGVFWGRKAFWKRPGIITVHIMPPLAAGLPPKDVMAQIEQIVETESDRLCVMAVREHRLEQEFPLLMANVANV